MGSSGYHSNNWHMEPPTSAGQVQVGEAGTKLDMKAGSSAVFGGNIRQTNWTTDNMLATASSESDLAENSGVHVYGSSNDERITITKAPQKGCRLEIIMTAVGFSSQLAKKSMIVIAGGGTVKINTSGRQIASSTNKNFKSFGRSVELVGLSTSQWFAKNLWNGTTGAQFWTISTSTA